MPIHPDWRVFYESRWTSGEWMRPAAALQALKTNPANFLKKYPILNTYDCNASGVHQAYFANYTATDARRPGRILGTLRMHEATGFRVNTAQFKQGEGDMFPLHGLYTGLSSQAPAWYQLGNTGPDIMLTAKLTGCTFVARPGAQGQVEVAHLKPDQETGLQLNTRMKVPGQDAFGRLSYDIDSRTVNVIGIRTGTNWQVFTQKLEKHKFAIRSVHRLFPA